jgi:hypothetical protein
MNGSMILEGLHGVVKALLKKLQQVLHGLTAAVLVNAMLEKLTCTFSSSIG